MPRPPSERSRLRSPWTKRSKTRGRSSAVIPMPSSRTRSTASTAFAPQACTQMWPPSGVYFAALLEQVENDLGEPRGVAVDAQRPAWRRVDLGDVCCRCVEAADGRPRSRGRRRSRGRSRSRCRVILPLVIRLTSSRSSTRRLRCPTCRSITSRAQDVVGSARSARAHHRHRVADRRERVAQLVAEHGQELVDLPALLLERSPRAAARSGRG